MVVFTSLMKLTWTEIRSRFPNEHVVIVNPQCLPNKPTEVESGEVADHDHLLDNLLNRCDLTTYERFAIRYTGDLGALIGQRGMIRVIEHD